MFFTPDRLIRAGTHRPTSTSRTVNSLFPPLLMNSCTYSTQPTAMPALPAHRADPVRPRVEEADPVAERDPGVGVRPPSAGSRRDSAANIRASTMAPIVVSPIEARVIGPIAASEVGRSKIPTPMTLPMTSAIATGSPKPPPAAAAVPAAPSPVAWTGAVAAAAAAPSLTGGIGRGCRPGRRVRGRHVGRPVRDRLPLCIMRRFSHYPALSLSGMTGVIAIIRNGSASRKNARRYGADDLSLFILLMAAHIL